MLLIFRTFIIVGVMTTQTQTDYKCKHLIQFNYKIYTLSIKILTTLIQFFFFLKHNRMKIILQVTTYTHNPAININKT